MMQAHTEITDKGFLPRESLAELVEALQIKGYRCLGPQVRDGAIVYDTIDSVDDLPTGVRLTQAPGAYRVERKDSPRTFAWANGPQALKPLTFAPVETLWNAARNDSGALEFKQVPANAAPVAVIGVRACDLAALSLQEQHFLQTGNTDAWYRARRDTLLLVAVNCTHPSDTCFCASTGDGPAATGGFDLVLDELEDGFVIHAGSLAGQDILTALELEEITDEQTDAAIEATRAAIQAQTRTLPAGNLYAQLFDNLEHPQWEDIAARCLSCGNCTSVCPTCFCYRETETAQLDGRLSVHAREWDSCFAQGHSYIHGLTIRHDTRLRYRQWLTHKLGGWHEQFGRSGCVGCGRCISWCPVGIDITAEVAVILGTSS